MKQSGIILARGSSIVDGGNLDFKTINHGFQGVLLFEGNPVGGEAQLVLKSPNDTNIVMGSSTPLGVNVAVPLSLPAGQYAINLVSSSAIGVFASLHPTP